MPALNSLSFAQVAQWCADNWVLILGFAAQGLFSARFFVQWITSEKKGRSVVPISFWYLSIIGGGMLLSYAILRRDPVFMLGQGCGLFIYIRNLYLIHRERARSSSKLPGQV